MNESTESFLSPEDYEDAIVVQDACNLSGIVIGFAKVMDKLCQESQRLGMGTDWRNTHPIAIMYSDKIASLTHSGSAESYSQAYTECRRRAYPSVLSLHMVS